MSYITVIGLEIHAELLTKTKMFCSCQNDFGGEPNSRVCPVCAGYPGTLPTVNYEAVRLSVMAGLCLDCKINEVSAFDRKNYFYPDLPKAYQISQLYYPICERGSLNNIRINNIHLEEDAGKLIHNSDKSEIDLNRCGVPLIEIVTEPDFRSADEVIEFVNEISRRFKYAGICDCRMEQGSIRVDLNISLMKETDEALGTRAEIKNINSLKAIKSAIKYEEQRQKELLDRGESVIQETRRFDENTGRTVSMRKKEEANDYRYFPEPDIPKILISRDEIEEMRAKIPVLPHIRKKHYTEDFLLSDADATLLSEDREFSDFFDEVCSFTDKYAEAAKLMLGELSFLLNSREKKISELKFSAKEFSELILMLETGEINRGVQKEILRAMFDSGISPRDGIKTFLVSVSDSEIEAKVFELIESNQKLVVEYFKGSTKAVDFFMGQLMRHFGKSINPKACKTIIIASLDSKKDELFR